MSEKNLTDYNIYHFDITTPDGSKAFIGFCSPWDVPAKMELIAAFEDVDYEIKSYLERQGYSPHGHAIFSAEKPIAPMDIHYSFARTEARKLGWKIDLNGGEPIPEYPSKYGNKY